MSKDSASFDLDVIVDVVFDDGLFFLRLQNIGSRPARDVSVSLEPKIMAPYGDQLINDLTLFKSLRFMAPGKLIDVFLGTRTAYFKSCQPAEIRATVEYLDRRGRTRRGVIEHDLSIYADLGYVRRTGPQQVSENP